MKAPFLLILVSLFSFTFYSSNAQEGKLVTGKVIDEYGLPIESASVVVQEKNKGVVTDLNGSYSISLSPDDLLEFSFIGFKTQSIIVGVQSVINITLIEDIEILDGVVITGYQNIDREIFTGSSQTLKAADIKLDGVPDITQALEGRAPGVAGGPGIALFRFLSGASLSFDICSDLVSFTSNGLLGQFGFYEFIFTKQ